MPTNNQRHTKMATPVQLQTSGVPRADIWLLCSSLSPCPPFHNTESHSLTANLKVVVHRAFLFASLSFIHHATTTRPRGKLTQNSGSFFIAFLLQTMHKEQAGCINSTETPFFCMIAVPFRLVNAGCELFFGHEIQ